MPGFFNRRTRVQPILILVIVITMGILLAVFLSARHSRRQPAAVQNSVHQDATLAIEGIRMTTTRQGATTLNLTAETGNYLDSHKKAIFSNISAVFHTDDGGRIFLTADKGIFFSGSNDLEVSGHVVLKNDQYLMKTEQLRYDHNRRILKSNAQVLVTGHTTRLAAESMSYYMLTEKITLNGNISGTISENIML